MSLTKHLIDHTTLGIAPADPVGTAAFLVAGHEASANPHPNYLTEVEADAKYALIGEGGGTAGVTSFNTRTGAVTANSGDYTADQITETATREFVTSAQKTEWSSKVDEAPTDGGSYVRTNAGWSSAASAAAGYTVETKVGSLANQVHAFSLPATNLTYNLDSFALKEEAGLTNQSVTLETFDNGSSSNYDQTSSLVWDGQLKTYTGGNISLSADGSFYSSLIPADGRFISISRSGTKITPNMTSNTSPAGYITSASSEANASYAAWVAFDGTVNVTNAWSSSTAPTEGSPQWLAVQLPTAQQITGYKITNRNHTSQIGSPNTWKLQGSNDGSAWDDLHTVTGDTNNTSAAVRSFSLPSKSAAYNRFRIYITSRNGSDVNAVTISELSLETSDAVLLRNGSTYYTSSNGTLTPVTTPTTAADFDATGFYSSGNILAASLTDKQPLFIVSGVNSPVTYVTVPYAQIAIQKALVDTSAYLEINSATITATETSTGVVRVAISRDLTSWYAYSGGQWNLLPAITNNISGANTLITQGMTQATLNALTSVEWALFYNSVGGFPDDVAIAYALEIQDTDDTAIISNLALNVDYPSAWKKQTPAEVEIRWYGSQVVFKTINAGNYKLAYQTP